MLASRIGREVDCVEDDVSEDGMDFIGDDKIDDEFEIECDVTEDEKSTPSNVTFEELFPEEELA